MRLLIAALLFSTVPSSASPKLTFTKEFPGSTPAYCSIRLDKSGALEYRESKDEEPLKAQMAGPNLNEMFSLAERLQFFANPIESGLKVANTGKKTFGYEPESGTPKQVVFNYSTNVDAQKLLDMFEQIAGSERAYIDLDRTVHFDRLGVNESLSRIESLWLNKKLIAAPQFLPILQRVSKQKSIMHIARERAAKLVDEIEAARSPSASPPLPNTR